MTVDQRWRRASGYTTKGGASRWRVVRDVPYVDKLGKSGVKLEEKSGRSGKLSLYLTGDAAQRAADALNTADLPAFDRLPARVRSVVETCRSGKTLCRGYRPRAVGNEDIVLDYWFEPGGRPAPPRSCKRAIEEGYLKPIDAGLFDDGNAQSFVASAE